MDLIWLDQIRVVHLSVCMQEWPYLLWVTFTSFEWPYLLWRSSRAFLYWSSGWSEMEDGHFQRRYTRREFQMHRHPRCGRSVQKTVRGPCGLEFLRCCQTSSPRACRIQDLLAFHGSDRPAVTNDMCIAFITRSLCSVCTLFDSLHLGFTSCCIIDKHRT